jgi:hypothetical protein
MSYEWLSLEIKIQFFINWLGGVKDDAEFGSAVITMTYSGKYSSSVKISHHM